MPVVVKISTKLKTQFVNNAKEAFPREKYAICLGRKTGNVFTVKHLYFPEDQDKYTTSNTVKTQEHWFSTAEELATFLGLSVLGDIHSHPYLDYCPLKDVDHAPSEADWQGAPDEEWLMGICVVRQSKTRKLASLQWWVGFPGAVEKVFS